MCRTVVFVVIAALSVLSVWPFSVANNVLASDAGLRPRVIISTDIGGTDPDDFQSLVHLLVYADRFDIEGLISSPYGRGRKEHLLQVIDSYSEDFAGLRRYSERFPTPQFLRSVCRQGAVANNGPSGVAQATDGSQWIVERARHTDARPLYVLVWGGIEDLAQALHDAPDILPKLRVFFIGGPNKMWSADAYNYIEQQHPSLWMIESNSTYRGWFVGGNQEGIWNNRQFANSQLSHCGSLGKFFSSQLGGVLKMGDSPSVGYLLKGNPHRPDQPSWGGQYARVWQNRKTVFRSLTNDDHRVEVYGMVEFALPLPEGTKPAQPVRIIFDNRVPVAGLIHDQTLVFRFSPRDAKRWTYTIESDAADLDGLKGSFTAVAPTTEDTKRVSEIHPNWWTDDQRAELSEGVYPGAKSINRFRQEILADFAQRMAHCQK